MSADRFRFVVAVVLVVLTVVYIAERVGDTLTRRRIIDDCVNKRSAMFAGDQRPRCESDYRQKTMD